jgi:3-deoxy-7-phosphoheptulonate synthase
MACASVAAGADGLLLEVHPDPGRAKSDGYQTLNYEQFEETMQLCRKVAVALDRSM